MELLTGEQMRRIDRRAIDELGVSGFRLMERAGSGVAAALLVDEASRLGGHALILCGKGNNGGDGLIVAARLLQAGRTPDVVLLAAADELRGDAAAALNALRSRGGTVEEVPDENAWDAVRTRLGRSSLVVDAILGTGVRGGARGLAGRVIDDVNAAGCRVCSIDVPSGLDADSASLPGRVVQAARTYTLCRPKIALAFDPAAGCCGEVRVIDIGMPAAAVRAETTELSWIDPHEVAALVGPREAAAHKGSFGHLLAVAGSRGKSGAAVLLARGALRSGVGLVTVAAAVSAREGIAVQQAEAMTESLAETTDGGLAAASADAVARLCAGKTALAIGPGLGREAETRVAVREMIELNDLPLVIDADGLNALDGTEPRWSPARNRDVVITPHPGEAARLLGRTGVEIQSDRLGAARELARMTGSVSVLKGRRTLVADVCGRVAVNPTGNPGMATGGTGDVLTGIVGALLARGLRAWDAARAAVWLHGSAGDFAAAELGQESMIASDLAARLPHAFRSLDDGRR